MIKNIYTRWIENSFRPFLDYCLIKCVIKGTKNITESKLSTRKFAVDTLKCFHKLVLKVNIVESFHDFYEYILYPCRLYIIIIPLYKYWYIRNTEIRHVKLVKNIYTLTQLNKHNENLIELELILKQLFQKWGENNFDIYWRYSMEW